METFQCRQAHLAFPRGEMFYHRPSQAVALWGQVPDLEERFQTALHGLYAVWKRRSRCLGPMQVQVHFDR